MPDPARAEGVHVATHGLQVHGTQIVATHHLSRVHAPEARGICLQASAAHQRLQKTPVCTFWLKEAAHEVFCCHECTEC
eukprot:1140532-Pelagomonas_calceolata.AAC.11